MSGNEGTRPADIVTTTAALFDLLGALGGLPRAPLSPRPDNRAPDDSAGSTSLGWANLLGLWGSRAVDRFVRLDEINRVRGELECFAAEMFASLRRQDQRRWGECYLRGLMVDGKRKSIQPMAAQLPDGNEQALQRFVSSSPWDPVPVREQLAQRMAGELAPEAVLFDDTGYLKSGRFSPGVARQYTGTLELVQAL